MTKPNIVIDKSMLQAICEQSSDKLDECFNMLLGRYVLVVPSVLVEEVWVNRAVPSRGKDPEVVERMVECLLHLQDAWIEEPLEIAFSELVMGQSIEFLPPPPVSVMDSFVTLSPTDPSLKVWATERKKRQTDIVSSRVEVQREILRPDESVSLENEKEFFRKLIQPKFVEMLSKPDRKLKLLEGVLGLAFRKRHPECSDQIDAAFESYSLENFDKHHATFICIMSALFYFYAPLCKIPGTGKISGRKKSQQRSNLNDERYVQSALLCDSLATRDQGMRNVMELFRAIGIWTGEIIFTNPGPCQNLSFELSVALKRSAFG